MEDEEQVTDHWLQQIRKFSQNALEKMRESQQQLDDVDLEVKQVEPRSDDVPSAWVDGGSGFMNLVGGSLYVVRAAAALFQPGEPPKWHESMDTGFTTLSRNVDRLVGLKRDTLEIECILELLDDNPRFAVLDNGLASYATMGVPYSIMRYFREPEPDKNPNYEFFKAYHDFMRRFDTLIRECQTLDIKLIGAAKDTRTRLLSKQLGIETDFNDSSTIAMLAGDRTGFTPPVEARYLEVPRVKAHLQSESILTDGRGDFLTMFGILKPHGRVFRLDYLKSQEDYTEEIQRFITSMHDGNGYLLPSHIVHNKALIPKSLQESLMELMISSIAKEDMRAARFVFNEQRRARFG